MRRLAWALAAAILLSGAALAQEETLLGGRIQHGGFGGPVVKLTQVSDRFGCLVGGHGGWILNHSLWLGGGGYGLANRIPTTPSVLTGGDSLSLSMGYGGFEFGFIVKSDRLVHLSFQTLVGAGGVSESEDFPEYDWEDDYGQGERSDAFFIVEPQVDIVLNVTGFLRIAAGASYRFVSGVESGFVTDSGLDGPSAVLSLHFGKF
jgi:hypothetical protein